MTEERPTPDEDIVIARRALAEREFRHALSHLGAAIVSDPTRREWLALLDEVAAAAGDSADLFPREPESPLYVGDGCVRAYLLAREGQYGRALEYLVGVANASPDRPFLDWGVGWLSQPGVAETTAAAATLRFLRACYERHVNQDRVVPALEAVVPIAERLRASHPEEPDAHFLSASLLRRSGRLDEALPVAKQAFEARPSWLTATGVALVLRAKKETEDAIEWYERALEFEADDLTARLDVADMLFEEAWELGRAVQAYEDLLRRQPGHPWAEPSAAAARALLTGREKWRARLLAIRAADPANARAQHLQEGLARTSQPYESYLPEPQEATASLGRRFVSSEEAVGGLLKIGVSHLEAPSCVQSVSQELQRRFGGISVAIQVKKIPSPDPRAPASGAKSLLWRYEETTPIAVPAPPEPTVANAIGRIASTRYDRDAWEREARETVPGLTSGALRSLIAVMVHPPPAPDGMAAWDWWRQVQFAASLVLAHFDVGVLRAWRRPGWKALVSIARGPIDWTTEAAIVGLATVARRDPDSEARVLEIYRELLARVPDEGYSCYSRCLVRSWMQLPSVSEQERDRLEEWAIARD